MFYIIIRKKRFTTCCYCNGVDDCLSHCIKCNIGAAHDVCLKRKGKSENNFVCKLCESGNNIYYEIFCKIVFLNYMYYI